MASEDSETRRVLLYKLESSSRKYKHAVTMGGEADEVREGKRLNVSVRLESEKFLCRTL